MPTQRYKQLVDQFALQIRQGTLPAGKRLPPLRTLAKREGIALVTATRVYAELQAMGLVSGETGRGTFVRDLDLPEGHGSWQKTLSTDALDLSFNYPLLGEETQLLRQALGRMAHSGDLQAVLRYQPHAGRLHEREAIARYLQSQQVQVPKEQVLVVNGAQHGLACTAIGLLRPGDVVAVDALTYSGFKTLALSLQLELLPLPMGKSTDQSDTIEALAGYCTQRKIRAVYCMPSIHNPTGRVMSLTQRERLVELARRHDLLLIEDAAYAFLADPAPTPIVMLAPERTVHVAGFSKNIATGLRVGYVVAPRPWLGSIEKAIHATAWNVPSLMTGLVCQWLNDGTALHLQNRKRQDATARQQIAKQALQGLSTDSHTQSYFVWLPLTGEARADRIATELLAQGIAVSTAAPFATTQQEPQALRLALGSVSYPDLEKALHTVREVVQWNSL
ncbi:PLP-dependent aminotransferase family protein [Curvibacter sp. CHRR-16]|uniref:aminotransferase-like domain-containing protein n=1 Tax=Curvibacter sp. CHRR-16 TaxID=2835872 RepID=UPI001BDA0A34|nr:PLP-dependent aminotransferase family protein [Curvibacter sp. CHRR-16]MBT0570366.1 PLP-dependent aminotransferase family protein [Curvibacter sp. CHRR-16]